MQLEPTPETLRALREILTKDQPVGPPDAETFTSDVGLLRLLYDPDNRIHEWAEASGAPFVIGRKGSGKTAFVMAPRLRDGVIAVELPAPDLYQGVFDVIRLMLSRAVTVFPEVSARLWQHMAWSAVLSTLATNGRKRQGPARIVHDFASSLGGGKVPATPDLAVSCYLRRLRLTVEQADQIGGLGDLLNSVSGNNHTILEAIDAGRAVIDSTKSRVVVIVDSLERYRGVLPSQGSSPVEQAAFEGLFQFVGKDGNVHDRPFDIRFAFPAELWPILEKVSANPSKDFKQQVIAHWTARELVRLAGTRLAIYGTIHDRPELVPERKGSVFSPMNYDEAREVLTRFLGPKVQNGLGEAEDPIAYVMRHTQLLPRHLITILNHIAKAQTLHDRGAPFPVSNQAIVEGVRHAEAMIVRDILSAYEQVHPFAELCCSRVIPNLHMVFTDGDLHAQFNRTGVKKETGLEYREFVQTLVEIGCIGAEMKAATTTRYVTAEFEYTRPGSLFIGDGTMRCLHPVFAEVFNCLDSPSRTTAEERSKVLPVYPYGSNPHTNEDYRERA